MSVGSCQIIKAFNHETLRLDGGAMVSRVVLQERRLAVKPDDAVTFLIPFRQLYTNEDVWGANIRNFQWDRFREYEDDGPPPIL